MNTNNPQNDIEQRIDQYINGELSANEIDELWVEIVQNPEYMNYLNTMTNLKEVVKDEKQPGLRKVWMYAAAAVIVLLLAVVGTLRFMNPENPASVEPISSIELDYYRSTDAGLNASDRDKIIRNAIELYNQDRFDEAVTLLKEEREKTEDTNWISELNMTLGTIHYNEDKFQEAAAYFSEIITYKGQIDLLVLEKAYWYLGNSYLQMDRMLKAEEMMKKAYALNGAYSRVAKSFLDALADFRAEKAS